MAHFETPTAFGYLLLDELSRASEEAKPHASDILRKPDEVATRVACGASPTHQVALYHQNPNSADGEEFGLLIRPYDGGGSPDPQHDISILIDHEGLVIPGIVLGKSKKR
ncbi:hypothetical protein IPL68_05550 [Candidatus Saccharibacteria bacterium]|nr:MAG: hypothetical protein IPL68_05550 [Candidatus Saccharibacteria bacterium]